MIKKLITSAVAVSMISGVLALPAMAQTASSTPSGGTSINLACMQAAVDKRDTALSAAVDAFASAIKSALDARKGALKAAWALTDKKARRAAIRAAWKAWTTSSQGARRDLNNARKAAWTQFYADRKSCGRGAAADDTATHNNDGNL